MANYVSKDCIKRIISDIKDITKNPLIENGIYYKHHEENMLKGYALIIANKESPYRYGNYLFEIDYPSNYPYVPPTITFLTNNDHTRFHPNLYRNGRVCLSLLNTWSGDEWSSCNTISSILLHISSLFTNHALTHEPGIHDKTSQNVINFDGCIDYQNIKTAIIDIIRTKEKSNFFKINKFKNINILFKEEILESFEKNKDEIINYVKEKVKEIKEDPMKQVLLVSTYSMEETVDYETLLKDLKKIEI